MAKVLVIDDERSMCLVIGAHLQGAGHHVKMCTDGALAIRSILDEKPDLVLLDLNMPYIDGFELLKALKGDPLTQAIPVIVVSSLTDVESLGRVVKLGASDYVYKPIRGDKLVASVDRVLREHTAP